MAGWRARAELRGGVVAQRAGRVGARDGAPLRPRGPLRPRRAQQRRGRAARGPWRLQPHGRRLLGQRRRARPRAHRRLFRQPARLVHPGAVARRRHAGGAGAGARPGLPRVVQRRDGAGVLRPRTAGHRRRVRRRRARRLGHHPHRRGVARRAGVVQPVAGSPSARAPGGGGRRHLGGARPRPGRRGRRVSRRHRQHEFHAVERSPQRRLHGAQRRAHHGHRRPDAHRR